MHLSDLPPGMQGTLKGSVLSGGVALRTSLLGMPYGAYVVALCTSLLGMPYGE